MDAKKLEALKRKVKGEIQAATTNYVRYVAGREDFLERMGVPREEIDEVVGAGVSDSANEPATVSDEEE